MNRTPIVSIHSFPLLILGIAVAFHAWGGFSVWEYTADDAFIIFRYSRHLASGFGPVFNTDDTHVEGYSSPLWMLLLASTHLISNDLETNSKLLGLSLNIFTLALATLILWNRFDHKRHRLFIALSIFWISISTPFIISAVEGLETPLLTFFTVLTLYLLEPREKEQSPSAISIKGGGSRLAVLLALSQAGMYFSRPDSGLAIIGIAGLWLLGMIPLTQGVSFRRKLDTFILCYALLGSLILIHLGWRNSYYGHLFPATYYAKRGGSISNLRSGVERIVSFAQETRIWYLVIFLPIALGIAYKAKLGIMKSLVLILLLIFSRVLFVMYSGGEIMGFHRFLVPVIPLLGLLWTWGLVVLDTSFFDSNRAPIPLRRLLVWWSIAIIVMASAAYQLRPGLNQVRGYREFLVENHERLGYWLQAHSTGAWLVAAGDVGVTFYVADNVRVLDLMGLNDYHIARLPGIWVPREKSPKSDVNYVLEKGPEIIVFRGDPDTQPLDQFQTIEKELIQSSAFKRMYVFVYATDWLHVYARQDISEKLGIVE